MAGLREGCVVSPCLFNLYWDRQVKEVSAKDRDRGPKV